MRASLRRLLSATGCHTRQGLGPIALRHSLSTALLLSFERRKQNRSLHSIYIGILYPLSADVNGNVLIFPKFIRVFTRLLHPAARRGERTRRPSGRRRRRNSCPPSILGSHGIHKKAHTVRCGPFCGAGKGSRTLLSSLGSLRSTDELYLRKLWLV